MIGPFDCLRELDPRGDADLPEDVAQVRFDGLLAQEELRGDLRIRLAVNDEPGKLKLALCEGCDAVAAASRRTAVVHGSAEFAQLAFGLRAVPSGAEGIEVRGRSR